MTTNLFKYLLVVENSQFQTLILLALILPLQPVNSKEISDALFLVQGGIIVVTGLISILSGTPLPLVIFQMTAQGGCLIIDAHRAQKSAK
ncbi:MULTISPECIES: hypothetical protein [Cyanophyceae]|uniref:hypothetical protein n=1 Tax=Cyanophyceae TaxID=3028117 RepID=UPI00168A0E4B|nr:hypothetical protein [Trichocoleus sp. FACHB-69]MBD1934825.1 hypothetical protein [Trichocoleus sp. FACHB-69]